MHRINGIRFDHAVLTVNRQHGRFPEFLILNDRESYFICLRRWVIEGVHTRLFCLDMARKHTRKGLLLTLCHPLKLLIE